MRTIARSASLSALFLLLCGLCLAAGKTAAVNFVVVKDFNGKPVRNASVVLHPVDKNGKQKQEGLQLKTNAEGRTQHPAIPFGKMRVQVIATGLQTFGEDYDINQNDMTIEIRLKRPQEQHSIYK